MISSSSISISWPSLSLPLIFPAGTSKFHPDPPKTIWMVSSTSLAIPRHDAAANDLAENDLGLNTNTPPRICFGAISDDGCPVHLLRIDRDHVGLQHHQHRSGDV